MHSTRNGHAKPRIKRSVQNRFRGVLQEHIANLVLSRSLFAAGASGKLDPTGRDLDKECGYPESPDIETYSQLYQRWGIAARCVNVLPDESWAVYPQVYEVEDENKITPFEKSWASLNRKIPVSSYLHRADRLSGLGTYGALLLGLNDGPLDRPVTGIDPKTGQRGGRQPKKPRELVYLRAFSEENISISEVETDSRSIRFQQPTFYQLQVQTVNNGGERVLLPKRVHWTRIIHLCDGFDASEVFAIPRLKQVLNYLLDLRKIGGGSAEMFWKGAFPGYSFETIPDLIGESFMDEETIKEQFQEYMSGLKRYLALDGVTAKALLPQTADPTAHANLMLMLICATLGCPMRVFLGSETGHLASTQDIGTWNKRVASRQSLYLEPRVLRPFIDRMVTYGIMDAPGEEGYIVNWKDLNTLTDKDKALITLQRAQALQAIASGKAEAIMPLKEIFVHIFMMTSKEAEAAVEAVRKNKDLFSDPLGDKTAKRDALLQIKTERAKPKVKPVGGATRGKPAKTPRGRPAGASPSSAA